MSRTIKSTELRAQMDAIYRDVPLERIPWNVEAPPALLVDIVESGRIAPCDAVDLGCGAGNHATWLAAQGFNVTGIDLSSEAIAHARRLAEARGLSCRFRVGDLVAGVPGLDESFDFGFDWEVLHHIAPEERVAYAGNVHRILRPDASYLSVTFSDRDESFGGVGKVRTTQIGTVLFFSSVDDIDALFAPGFEMLELGEAEIAGKRESHTVVRALMRRK